MYRGERFNAISHLVGSVLAAAGVAVLVVVAARQDNPWKVASFAVYGITLFMLYVFSALYHSLRGRAKDIFRTLDHGAIYLLIAGTYTPVTLVALRGPWGWSLFGINWGLAVLGITQEYLLRKRLRTRIFSVVLYVLMGWLALIALPQLAHALPAAGLMWLVVGGMFYTVGIVFYALDDTLPHSHGIWHLFVLAGSISQYAAMFYLGSPVIPQ